LSHGSRRLGGAAGLLDGLCNVNVCMSWPGAGSVPAQPVLCQPESQGWLQVLRSG
jgi:hypothetical protein